MEHRASTTTDSSLLWEAEAPQHEPKRLSLLIDSYYDNDSWSAGPTEQDTVDEHLNLSYLLEAEFCCYQEEPAESEAEPLSHGVKQASVDRFLELRHLLDGEFGIPSPAASEYGANSFFAAGNLGGQVLADGTSPAEPYAKPQDLVDEHLKLSYSLEDHFRRARDASPPPTPQDTPAASGELTVSSELELGYTNKTDAAPQDTYEGLDNLADIDAHFALYSMLDQQALDHAPASCEQPLPSISVKQTDDHKHLALSYQLEDNFRDQSQADPVSRSLSDEQATIDAHLALSYLLEAAFRDHLQADAAASLASHEQAIVDAHYELSYALEAEFRDHLQAKAASRSVTEEQDAIDEHYALSYELETKFHSQLQANAASRAAYDVREIIDAHYALSYELEAGFKAQSRAKDAARSASDAQASSNEVEAESQDQHQANGFARSVSAEQPVIDAHYALSYELENAFKAQLQAATSEQHTALDKCCDESETLLGFEGQVVVDAHLALSYSLEREFISQLSAPRANLAPIDREVTSGVAAIRSRDASAPGPIPAHDITVPDPHERADVQYEQNDAHAAGFRLVPPLTSPKPVATIEMDLGPGGAVFHTLSTSSPAVSGAGNYQHDVDQHLRLSYAYESAFLRESLRLASSPARTEVANYQHDVDQHLHLSYAYESAFLRESLRSAFSSPAPLKVASYQQDVDQHLRLSYAYESAFLRESLRSASSPALTEVANYQQDVDQHLLLSYSHESAFLRESLRSAACPALTEVANYQQDVDQHLLLSYSHESAFLRESLRKGFNPTPSEVANCQQDVDQHLLLSYAYESVFLRKSLRLEEGLATVQAHQRQPSQEEDLWTLYASEDVHQRNASCSSSASSGSSTTATNSAGVDPRHAIAKEEDEIKPFVQSWTEEVQHLSTLAASLRSGRGRAAWKAYLAIPASDESIIIMRNHLAQKWGTKPRAEWVDELISIMEDELTGLRDNKPVAADAVREPPSASQQAHDPEKEELVAQAEQLKKILSRTEEIKSLVSLLGFTKSPHQPIASSAYQFDELMGALSILLSQAPGLASSLADTRKRLAARDEYLASTVASSARDMNGLQEMVTELRAANQELTEELQAERAGRRCVERELVRLERTRAIKPIVTSRRADTSPTDSSSVAAILSEFKKMSARVEALERDLQSAGGVSPSTESRPRHKPRIFIPASVNMTDKLDSPTPPASPPHLMSVCDIKTPSAYI
ncbi:hypothetical protein HDU87_004108 [Geranomyces variabilis]|uniref:Uncharacterized protein n=1 Tax=Geranomyces variabilis TaxID=109894 RepID=A0AAD5TTD1_9FUNG|nr:hypothetical protein HDU87_004108 [Geranomyces variabilis]